MGLVNLTVEVNLTQPQFESCLKYTSRAMLCLDGTGVKSQTFIFHRYMKRVIQTFISIEYEENLSFHHSINVLDVLFTFQVFRIKDNNITQD